MTRNGEYAFNAYQAGGDPRTSPVTGGPQDITLSENEISYNNTCDWEKIGNFPITRPAGSAVYVSESGGDSYDNACTLVDHPVATIASCHAALAKPAHNRRTDTPDYFDLCRWKTQNVRVSGNDFNFNAADIGATCTVKNYCGFNGLFSQYGTTSPYKAWRVPLDISDNQNDVFTANTYAGPWRFDGFSQGDVVNWSQWTAGFEDSNGSNDFFNSQDAGEPDLGAVLRRLLL